MKLFQPFTSEEIARVVQSKELYRIINNDLEDFDIFSAAIKKLLGEPEKFNLSIE